MPDQCGPCTSEMTSLETEQEPAAEEEVSKDNEEQKKTPVKIDTVIIFNSDAYMEILPYCKAILEPEKVRDEEDAEAFDETLGIFLPAVVLSDLDAIASEAKQDHLKISARRALRMVTRAERYQNPFLERQACANSPELQHPLSTNLKADAICEQIQLLSARGASVITVTDDSSIQAKFSPMSLKCLSLLDFVNRYHWLTPTVTSSIDNVVQKIPLEQIFEFAQLVANSVIWKGGNALLAPLPSASRIGVLPQKPLAKVLKDLLNCNRHLAKFLKQAPMFNLTFDMAAVERVHQLWLNFHSAPEEDQARRFNAFMAALQETTKICEPIAGWFGNMQTRVEMLNSLFSVLEATDAFANSSSTQSSSEAENASEDNETPLPCLNTTAPQRTL